MSEDSIIYDVALWRYWPSSALPFVGDITATSPLLAALTLMQQCKQKRVAYAAVAAPGGIITRYITGLSLSTDESPFSAESEEVML